MFIKAYSYFFKSKWRFFFNLVWDQANGPRIKSSTFNCSFNLKTSKHNSRSSFITPSDWNNSWRLNQRNLLYYFIVKIHTEDCTHVYTNQMIICYTISWLCDLSFTKIVCTHGWSKDQLKNYKKDSCRYSLAPSSSCSIFSPSQATSCNLICQSMLHILKIVKKWEKLLKESCWGQVFHTTWLYFIGDPHHINIIMDFGKISSKAQKSPYSHKKTSKLMI